MSDIFLSYASKDRNRAKVVAEALIARGFGVWWDQYIPTGRTFDAVIEEAIDGARCVIVLWSGHSVRSDWVKTEAAEGAKRNVLVPAMLEAAKLPLEFRRIQAADLTGWSGDDRHPEFVKIVDAVGRLVGKQPLPPTSQPRAAAPSPSPTSAALSRRNAVLFGVAVVGLSGAAAWRWWPSKGVAVPTADPVPAAAASAVASAPATAAATPAPVPRPPAAPGPSLARMHDEATRWSERAKEAGIAARKAASDSSSDSRAARGLAPRLAPSNSLSDELGFISTKARLAYAAADRAESAARRALNVLAGWPSDDGAEARSLGLRLTGDAKTAAAEAERAAAEASGIRDQVRAAYERVLKMAGTR